MERQIFFEMLKQLYAIDNFKGYTEQEIDFLKQQFGTLPKVLEDYYRTAGHTEKFHQVQDQWILPEDFKKSSWLRKSDHMILMNENQGVCQAGINRKDLTLYDPPVYTTYDDKTWVLCASTVSEFLAAALAFEAVFTFDYSPEEFYWLTKEEMKVLSSGLSKYPFELQNWVGDMKVMLYYNAPDNLVAVLDCGDLEMLYGAASQASYDKLMTILKGIGEPI